jgi:hypothetical protein
MNFSDLTEKLPFIALAIGALLLLWGQRSKLTAWIPKLNFKSESMSPTKRFEKFYALRSWCDKAGHTFAVEALDDVVLGAIVCDSCPYDKAEEEVMAGHQSFKREKL